MLALIVAGKFLVWSIVVWLFRYPLRTAIAVASGLTQIGELSFVFAQVSRSAGVVEESIFSTVIAASLVSILLNAFVVRAALRLVDRGVPARHVGQTSGYTAVSDRAIGIENRRIGDHSDRLDGLNFRELTNP